MRRANRNGPKCIDARTSAAIVPARAEPEYPELVELARRMSIPEGDAFRQFVDRAMGVVAADRPAEPD